MNPDLLCCGKAMGSGFPLSGVISNSKIMNIPKIGDMSSTHSANPIVCSAGLATLEEIKSKKLVSKSKKLGDFFRKELLKTPIKIINGYVPVQTSPGLGIEVNNEIIKKFKINL